MSKEAFIIFVKIFPFFLIVFPGFLNAEGISSLQYVNSLENPNGGFWPNFSNKGAKSSLRATVSALRVYKYEGVKMTNYEKHQKFISSCWDSKIQGFADYPGGPVDVILTAVGLMGARDGGFLDDKTRFEGRKYLVENSKSFEEIRMASAYLADESPSPEVASAWQKIIESKVNKDGTYGAGFSKARDSASAWVTLLRLQIPIKYDWMLIGDFRKKDGGFGSAVSESSDLETAYRVCRYFYMVKDKEMLRGTLGFVERCKNDDGGFASKPGEKSSLSSTYHATIIKNWADSLNQK